MEPQTRQLPVADWDPLDPAALADPFAAHARLRDKCPVARADRWGGFWTLMRHEDVIAAALDPETFISGEKTTIPDSTGADRPPRPPLEVDRPEHTHYRRLLAPYFSPERARQLEPSIRRIAGDLIDAAVAERECDLVPAVALPMPALVLCEVLGLPAEDWSFLKRWTTEVIEAGRAGASERHARANDAMYSYVHSVVEGRRTAGLDPAVDIITGLLELVVDGRQLDDGQVTGVVRLLLQAGHNTTTNGLGSSFRYLGAATAEQTRLREDPSLIPAAVDEILRAFSPAQFLARTVTREVEVSGRTLCPGDKVGLSWASANRDPEAFPHPDRVDLARAPNRHVAFGYGIHRCLGAHLARVEMCVALEELLARTTRFELIGPAPEIGWPHIGPRSVPVRLH
ncbi:MAG TPA: cytochrome P450 [Solirubrobacteraceae bacterium]|nr:cytochrome P450 [Solirubrobacteraceae bacterium]